jgi:hypothetical protein
MQNRIVTQNTRLRLANPFAAFVPDLQSLEITRIFEMLARARYQKLGCFSHFLANGTT